MKRIILPLLITTFLFSCRHTDNDPLAVSKVFINAVLKKDFDEASKYASKNSQPVMDMLRSAEKAYKMFGKEDKFDIVKDLRGGKLDYSEPKIDGTDRATLNVLVDGKEKMILVLVKEEGEWKVAFDIATIMDTERNNPPPVNDSTISVDNNPSLDSISTDSSR